MWNPLPGIIENLLAEGIILLVGGSVITGVIAYLKKQGSAWFVPICWGIGGGSAIMIGLGGLGVLLLGIAAMKETAIPSRPQPTTGTQTDPSEKVSASPVMTFWTDSNKRTWTQHDSERALDYRHAKAYCESLNLKVPSEWGLPTLTELRTLYDKSESRSVENFEGYIVTIHINKNILVKNLAMWSSSPGGNGGVVSAFKFSDGQADKYASAEAVGDFNVLCIQTQR